MKNLKYKTKNIKSYLGFTFYILRLEKGQALITLLFFMVIGITVISAATLIVAADILSASNAEQGLTTYYDAESGIEDGILYVLSHPTANGVTLTLPNASVTINTTNCTGTISSTGTESTTSRKLSVQMTNCAITPNTWTEQ